MLIDKEVYLEHFGVPGMKWGRRKAQERSERRAARTPEEKRAAKVRTVKIVAGTAAAIAGALFVRSLMKNARKKQKVKDFPNILETKRKVEQGAKFVKMYRARRKDGSYSYASNQESADRSAKAMDLLKAQ